MALLFLFVCSCERGDEFENGDECRYLIAVDARAKAMDDAVVKAGSVDTKVSVGDDEKSLVWDNSDKLSVVAVSADGSGVSAALEVLSLSDGGANAKFSGSVDMEKAPEVCYFAYPNVDGALLCDGIGACATFAYDAQTGVHKPFLYGADEYSVLGMNVALHHIGGMLRIKLPDASTVHKITVIGNDNEQLTPYVCNIKATAGNAGSGSGGVSSGLEVSVSGAMAQGAATSFDVELSVSSLEQRDGSYYCYIAMPPVKFAKGFSLIFSNGSQSMYKSFNYTASGGCDFSLSAGSSSADGDGSLVASATLCGSIVDIDASKFEGYDMSASLTTEHLFENDILTGTEVKIVGAAMQGYPASVVTEWGVELCNGQGEVVRSIRYENLSGGTGYTKPLDISDANSATMVAENGWPYLPQGSYTVKPYVKSIYSGDNKQYSSSWQFTVPALDASKLKPTVSAVTSYSYYLAGDKDNMNKPGTGSSIYNISSGVNISDAILQNSNYSVTATVVDNSTSGNLNVSAKLTASAGQILLAQYDVTEWKAYQLASHIEFDGVKSSQATTTVHVTGLPFNANPPTASDGWGFGDFATIQSGGLRLGGATGDWQTKKSTATSPVFHVPDNIKFKLSINITKVTTAWSSQTLTIATYNGSSTSSTVISTKQQTCSNLSVSGTGSFTTSYNRFYLENSATVIGRHFTIHTFNLEYE